MELAVNKTELAQRYGWTLKFLRTKINTTPGLLDALKKADYNLYQRVLTPLQVDIIYNYLGNPQQNTDNKELY
jgi:hypothetical protein